MMTATPFLPVLIPLIGGVLVLLAHRGGLNLQRLMSLLLVLALLLVSVDAMQTAIQMPPQVYALGNWIAPFGIVLVLDQLSALMVLITALLALGALWYAVKRKVDAQGAHFHVLFQIQLFGLNGAFLTGDVFNLFVFFEVLLLASYGLLLHGSGRLRTRAGLHYVAINLIGSTLFLFAVGALYGVLGTLNIADMANKIAHLDPQDQGVVAAAGLLLLLVFGIKAALFPLYLWLPQAYANTTAPVAALFAIMTKVGLYAIIRVHGTLFGDQAGDLAGLHLPWILWLGLITMLMAAFGTLAARGLREQVAYLVLASVATLLVGIGLNSIDALSATLYYLIHSTLIAGGFFLLADLIAKGRGAYDDRFVSGPATPKAMLLGATFLFAAIAMSGLPPLSGFFGKVLILSAALDHPAFSWIIAVVLLSGLMMIMALARSGSLLFYNTLPENGQDAPAAADASKEHDFKGAYLAVASLLSAALVLVALAHPLGQFTQSVAQQVFDAPTYLQQVLHTPAVAKEAIR
ncbi:monovalent cation/H+ antiporter subunit D [Thiomicrorhabdus sp. zzn3]|uniref:monovalent cation/H+ antiporter subunit D n=1 Tax=Thiomicrorhabdus sp. zzn3 TaxID=3039775 RepID=UPI002436E103|nr:monovalent cation/H+ antiporter subunit D [Thiomicrorhabdus sp. zzn3]MDG6778770.1 monovalent cation/H+ antiporter subunit D [Thiomicrorhabdus sp. zzn3]